MADDDESKILTTIKAALGLQPDYTPFDTELTMHINSVFAILNQLGLGPEEGFVIDENTAWQDILEDSKVESVKTYVFLRVKIIFDSATMPPAVLAAYERTISELEFRISVAKDPLVPWAPPEIDLDDDVILILDGGGA